MGSALSSLRFTVISGPSPGCKQQARLQEPKMSNSHATSALYAQDRAQDRGQQTSFIAGQMSLNLEQYGLKYATLLAQANSKDVQKSRLPLPVKQQVKANMALCWKVQESKVVLALLRALMYIKARQGAQQRGFLMAICTSQAKVAATYQILQTAASEVAAEKVKTANLRKERNAAQADTVTLQAQAEECQRETSRMEAIKTSLEEQLVRAEQANACAKEDKTCLQNQVQSLQLDLERAQLDKGQQEQHSNSLQGQLRALEHQIQSRQREHAQATADVLGKQEQLEQVKQQLVECEGRNADLSTEVQRADTDASEKLQLIKQLYERCGVSEARVASLIAEQQEAARNATLQLQAQQVELGLAQQRYQDAEFRLAHLTTEQQQTETSTITQSAGKHEEFDQVKQQHASQARLAVSDSQQQGAEDDACDNNQAVYIPSMPWWDPATADLPAGYAMCDPCHLETNPGQEPVVHAETTLAECGNMTGNTVEQTFNCADQDKTCLQNQFQSTQLDLERAQLDKGQQEQHSNSLQGQLCALEDQILSTQREHAQATADVLGKQKGSRQLKVQQKAEADACEKLEESKGIQRKKTKKGKKPSSQQQVAVAKQSVTDQADPNAGKGSAELQESFGASRSKLQLLTEAVDSPCSPAMLGERRVQMVDSDSSLPSSPELLHELRKQLAEAQQQAKTLQAEFQEDLSRLKKQNAIPRLPLDNTWQLGKVLGKGSSGSVLETLSLHYPYVVLKQGPHKKIEAEAEKLWQLDHPNIASVYATLHSQELGANNEFVGYMALERLGPSLCAMRDAQKMFTVQELVVGFYGVVCGLAHMHSKGLVDQDLNEGNVMQSLDGTRWVKADLGNAAWVEIGGKPNKISWCMCPVNWEPPEVAKALLEQRCYQPEPSSDIWSLGRLMLDTVAGDIPEAQWVLQNTAAYLRERAQSGCLRPTELPAQREHLEYLSKLMTDPSSTDYADQVEYPDELNGSPDSADSGM